MYKIPVTENPSHYRDVFRFSFAKQLDWYIKGSLAIAAFGTLVELAFVKPRIFSIAFVAVGGSLLVTYMRGRKKLEHEISLCSSEPRTLVVEQAGVALETDSSREDIPWRMIEHYALWDTHWMFHLNNGRRYVFSADEFPERAVAYVQRILKGLDKRDLRAA